MKEIEQEKTEMNKKMIPSLLCAGIIASMTATPLYANTAATDKTKDGSSVVGKSGVNATKSVVLNNDGTYTINLEAYSTGSTATSTIKRNVPLDVVLVMDQSRSLSGSLSDVKTAAMNFVNSMVANSNDPEATEKVEHRVAVVGFAGQENDENTELFVNGSYKQYQNLSNSDYEKAFMPVTGTDGQLNTNVSKAINGLDADGGTRPGLGLDMANNILATNPATEDRNAQRVVVLFTDGAPGQSSYEKELAAEAIEKAYTTKNDNNALVYTIGFFEDRENVEIRDSIMNLISSNYPQGQPAYGDTWYSTNKPSTLPVVRPDYYVKNFNGEMVRVTPKYISTGIFQGHVAWFDDQENEYPTGEDTDFYYTRHSDISLSAAGPAASNKYYLTGDQAGDLNNIFDSVISDVITPSTEVTLGTDSVIRDVIEKGFKITEDTQVSYEVYKGTADKDGNITFDRSQNAAETNEFQIQNSGSDTAASGISTAFQGQNIDVKGFNFSKNYVALNHDGYMIKITVKGILPDEANASFNKTVYTNGENSGIYENQTVADEAGTRISFLRPTTYLADKAYVVDYAKKISMNADDWKLATVDKVAGNYQNLSTVADGFGGFNNIAVASGKFEANGTFGAAYTPKTTKWEKIDKFFAFGETQDTEILGLDAHKETKNLWTRVSVVPANSVYYEDTFVNNEETGTVGIEYTGAWTQSGKSASDNYETSKEHGQWSDASNADSDGTHHVVDAAVVDEDNNPSQASYSFTGTGTSIYSRTNMDSGTIIVQVKGTKLNEKGKPYSKTSIIDTKSFSSQDGSYYTVPTFSVTDLPHDTYTVKLTVTTGAAAENRTKFYLDGIRVYNPLNDGAAAKGLDDVYAGEYNAQFHSVKKLVTGNASVFIDEIIENGESTPTISNDPNHTNSPANEVYLNKQQSIVIKVPEGSHDHVYVGLKSHDGNPVNVQLADRTIEVNSTMDQYWEVTPDANGCVVIKNNSAADGEDNLVAVTNVRTAYSEYVENPETPVVTALTEENALASYQTFAAGLEEDPGEDVPGEDVEIDNGDDDDVNSDSGSKSWWEILFDGLFGWFH